MMARGKSRLMVRTGRHVAFWAGVALCAVLSVGSPAVAQEQLDTLGAAVDVPSDAQLFLEADTVVYDRDKALVTADGGVQIDYGGYKLVAKKVTYNQQTKRLVAIGDVEMVQPDGNRVYADSADITDDFADGFITALRIETPDNTRFAAQGAVRETGNVTTFEKGVYTACEACKEHPERAPLWQVKARKIVWDQQEKVIRYYGAKFEFFGLPIAYMPYFQAADPTVKRKSGFLTPSFKSSEDLGYGLRVPYFFALSDSHDMTVAGTYYSKQGFLGEVEYRQAFNNGFITLQAAGISQNDPDAFDINTVDIGEVDRGMIGTTGRFDLNDRWTFGWDILAQTDDNFSQTYGIENFNDTFHTSEIYLSGLGDRSFFDLRAQRFDLQAENNGNPELNQDLQPEILPTLDYETINESPIGGGEIELDANVVNLHRRESAGLVCAPGMLVGGICTGYYNRSVLEGDYRRGTANAEWRRTLTTDQGLLLTPSLGLRGDIYQADMSIPGIDTLPGSGVDVDEAGFRGMATAALEARYPILIETANSSHVIEPIGQLIIRPNETQAGNLPNEDAQSLVFSTGNLFEKDKFSGYDRIEGGSRANIGLRYAGTFATGYSLDAMFGQSYHISGDNPYDEVDLALVGFDSGLETDRSDYVSSLTLGTPIGLQLGVQGRFDEESFEVRRTDLSAAYGNSHGSISTTYSFIGAQEVYGAPVDRSQVSTGASLKLTENWTAFGSLAYDIENSTMISRSAGLGYLDECFSLLVSYTSTESAYQVADSQKNTVMFTFGLRTIADFNYDYKLDE